MLKPFLRAFALAAALFAAASNAPAAGDFLTRLMGHAPHAGSKLFACFKRAYDEAHLAAHPLQNLRAAEMLVVAYSDDYQLRLNFAFRGRPEAFETVAECALPRRGGNDTVGDRCSIIGRTHPVSLAIESDDAVELILPEGADLWRPGPPDPKHPVTDAFGPDDKRIRLDRRPLSECADEGMKGEEKALSGG